MSPASASRAGATPEASRDTSSGTFADNMSLRSQSMMHNPSAFREKYHLLPQTIWRGHDLQPVNSEMTAPDRSEEDRELILSEHWMSSVVRPISERVLLPTVNRMPGTNDRHQEEAETQATFHAALNHQSNKANRAIDLTLHRCHAGCYGLRPHPSRHRFRARHRRRSLTICRFALRG
jgi:hypothetical protein